MRERYRSIDLSIYLSICLSIYPSLSLHTHACLFFAQRPGRISGRLPSLQPPGGGDRSRPGGPERLDRDVDGVGQVAVLQRHNARAVQKQARRNGDVYISDKGRRGEA